MSNPLHGWMMIYFIMLAPTHAPCVEHPCNGCLWQTCTCIFQLVSSLVQLTAKTTDGSFTIPSVPCLSFGAMSLSATAQISPVSSLQSFNLSGSMGMCGVGQAVVNIAYITNSSGQKQIGLTGVWTPTLPSPFQTGSVASISLSKATGGAYMIQVHYWAGGSGLESGFGLAIENIK